MKRIAAIFALALIQSAPALADQAFDHCLAEAMGAFDRSLAQNAGPSDPNIALLSLHDVTVCGGAGIQACDLQADRITCQGQLRRHQDAVAAQLLASLPEPSTLDVPATHWSENLYPLLWGLAHGSSAGPDCAGNGAFIEAWCEAVEANRRLGSGVMAWQMARLLEAVPPAAEAGWVAASPPPPPTPNPRGG